jgi:hypothetical protein
LSFAGNDVAANQALLVGDQDLNKDAIDESK